MTTYSVDFEGDVAMVGDDPHPPLLTTLVRPNLVVSDAYCLCYITEIVPAGGIGLHAKGAIKATAVCSRNVADLFTAGSPFELRAASRVFAKGTFQKILSKAEVEQETP